MAAAEHCKIDIRFCEPCSFDEIEVSASAFCTICTEYLCNDCTKGHRRNKVTRHHKILGGDDLPSDPSAFLLMKKLTSCSDHPDIPITFKCNEHDTFICTSCLAFTHRKCENITEVCNSVNSVDIKSAKEKLVKSVSVLQKKTAATRLSKEKGIDNLRTDEDKIAAKLEQVKENIKRHYDELLKKSKAELKVIAAREIEGLRASVDKCKSIEKEEKEKEGLLDAATHYGSDVEYHIIHEIVAHDISRLENAIQQQGYIGNVQLKFNENVDYKTTSSLGTFATERTNDISNDMALLTGGSVFENSSDIVDEECSNSKSCQKSLPPKERLILTRPTSVKSQLKTHRSLLNRMIGKNVTNLSTKHDNKYPWAISRIRLSIDGRLVLTDINNKHILVINEHFSKSYIYRLDASPVDLCEISPNLFAVIMCNSRKVSRFLLAESGIIDDGGFPTALFPLSISQYNAKDMTVLILFSNKTHDVKRGSDANVFEVQIRNYRDGQVISVINDFQTLSHKSMILHNPKCVSVVNRPTQRIWIAEHDVLRCFEKCNSILKQLWHVRSKGNLKIDNITDVVTDTEGNSYICCIDSKNIIQVPANEFMQSRVITANIQRPLSLAINEERGQLLVFSENASCIRVYDFK